MGIQWVHYNKHKCNCISVVFLMHLALAGRKIVRCKWLKFFLSTANQLFLASHVVALGKKITDGNVPCLGHYVVECSN